MIRDHEWKYIHRYAYGPHELYDLRADPGETRNLADEPQQATRTKHYRDRLEAYFARHADPARDGVRQPVTGRGQLDRVGAGASLPCSFASRHAYSEPADNRWGLFPPR
jgi:hypothetical protein